MCGGVVGGGDGGEVDGVGGGWGGGILKEEENVFRYRRQSF